MRVHLATAAPLLLLLLTAGRASGGYEPYIAEVVAFGFNFCPTGYLPADGRLLPIAQYTAVFALMGTTYGGNGLNNFAIPTIQPNCKPSGFCLTYCLAVEGIFPSRP
ncbi:hypothetical protein ABPG77_003173 [Micractinium sp. CCAP 211/92]